MLPLSTAMQSPGTIAENTNDLAARPDAKSIGELGIRIIKRGELSIGNKKPCSFPVLPM
jgi:hypothetical protein